MSIFDYPQGITLFTAFVSSVFPVITGADRSLKGLVVRFFFFPYWALLLIGLVCLVGKWVVTSFLYRIYNTYRHEHREKKLRRTRSEAEVLLVERENDIVSPVDNVATPRLPHGWQNLQ